MPAPPLDLTLRAWHLPLRARPGVAQMPTSPAPAFATPGCHPGECRDRSRPNAHRPALRIRHSAVGFATPGLTRSRSNASQLDQTTACSTPRHPGSSSRRMPAPTLDLPLRARPGVAQMPTAPHSHSTLRAWHLPLRAVIPANAGSAVGFATPGSTRSRPNAQWPHTPPLRFFIPAALGSSSDDCMLIIWRLRAVIPANAGPAVGFATPGLA